MEIKLENYDIISSDGSKIELTFLNFNEVTTFMEKFEKNKRCFSLYNVKFVCDRYSCEVHTPHTLISNRINDIDILQQGNSHIKLTMMVTKISEFKPKHPWHYYPLQVKYDESKLLIVNVALKYEPTGFYTIKRRFCLTCLKEKHHLIQQDMMEVFDCKAVFYNEFRQVQGQCCCSCKEHGMRN